MKRRAPKMRGRRCHAAWRLQSAPGPWAPEACLTRNLHSLIYYISIILVFFLGYILSGGFFDVKLGGCGVTPPPAQTPFFASIFSITLVPFNYVIPTSATPNEPPLCSHFRLFFDHTCTFYLRNTCKCQKTVFPTFFKILKEFIHTCTFYPRNTNKCAMTVFIILKKKT